jgi:DNA-directed RNA polymerase I, II, and III subunit RPABC1
MNDGDKLVVFFCKNDKFNIADFKRYISLTDDLKLSHCIIIYKDQITPSVNKQIDNFDCEIELFSKNELQYNITKHRFVPKHELVVGDESSSIRRKFGNNLPILLKTDPVSRFFNYRKGDIIKITRDNDIVAFRIVK